MKGHLESAKTPEVNSRPVIGDVRMGSLEEGIRRPLHCSEGHWRGNLEEDETSVPGKKRRDWK